MNSLTAAQNIMSVTAFAIKAQQISIPLIITRPQLLIIIFKDFAPRSKRTLLLELR